MYLAWNHSGAAGDADRDTAGLRVGPKPLTEAIGSKPYLDVQTAHDLAFAWGTRSFIKGHNANDVRTEALDELVEVVAEAPGDSSVSITALGGAIGRVPEEATAFAGRDAAFDLSADSSWTDAALDDANVDWCRRAMAVLEPDRTLGAYSNGNSDTGDRGDARDLRRGEGRPARGPQADLGPGQRVPREPQHRTGRARGLTGSASMLILVPPSESKRPPPDEGRPSRSTSCPSRSSRPSGRGSSRR